MLDELRAHGCAFQGLTLRSADDRALAVIPTPAMLGAYRPTLAELLAGAAVEAGVKVRLGASVELFVQDRDGVDVLFSDGDGGRYDLLVGADGAHSDIRARLGIDAAPTPIGLGIWRVHARRPTTVQHAELCHDGPCYIPGFTPTSRTRCTPTSSSRPATGSARRPRTRSWRCVRRAAAYHGSWDAIRDDITDADRINYALVRALS